MNNSQIGIILLGVGAIISLCGTIYAVVSPHVGKDASLGLGLLTLFLGGMCADSIGE